MKYSIPKRRAWGLMVLAIALLFSSRAVAQMCPVPVTNGCRTTARFSAFSGCTPYLGLNGDLGDYGSIFFDANTPGCMEDAREYLDDKIYVQNLDPQNWRQWLNGGDVFLMTAAALRLGDAHLLTPDLHQQILQALDDYEYVLGPNGTCTSSNGNSCMDNYTVHAAGAAWAAAYLTKTGTAATPGGRTAQFFKNEAFSYLDKTFSQTESICIHRVAAAQPYDACTNCQLISDANELRDKIVNGELEVLSYEHNSENPSYGAGLLPVAAIAFQGLTNAGVTYAATDLQKVIAHGLARTAQLHTNGGSACSASWLSNCPRISCPGGANPCPVDLCTSANQTTATCITDTCAPVECKDLDYKPGMYPIYALLTNPTSPLAGPTGILLPGPSYQFNDFCPSLFSTTDGFFHDGRKAGYYEIPYVWAFVSQPPLGGVTPDTTPPQSFVDVPATGQRMPAGSSFSGWAFDSQEWLASLSFTIDGQSFTLQSYNTILSRPDVCAFFNLYWKPSTCSVGWTFSFVPPAGLASGSHVLRVTTSDKFGNVSTFDRTFMFDTPPAASFTSSCTGLSCTFNGGGSTDDAGIASWAWSFGDGATGSGQAVSHSYSTGGTYTVQLTVTDTVGQTRSTSQTVTADRPPTASFSASCTGRTCSFNGSGSSDDHGISAYSWNFGDGTTGSGVTASRTYAASGTFTVTLTVTDTVGQTAGTTRTVTPNLPPTASFTASCSARTCSFNAGGSSDDVGISSYAWSFGDGTTGSGVTASRTYAASGTFTVTLTVTDTLGATATTSRTVTPNLPPTASFTASCSARTCSFNAGGSSDDLGISSYSWTFGDGGTGSGVTASHAYASAAAVTVTLTVTDTTGQTASTSRVVNPDLPPNATFTLSCTGRSCNFSASASSDDLGITSYAWNFGDGSPAGSGVTSSHAYAANGTYTVTLTVTDTGGQGAQTTRTASAVDNPPVAGFFVGCSGLTCTAVAQEDSHDDVGVVNYTWAWGDGQTTSGGSSVSTSSHTFASYATYTIMLTVRDVANQTASVSHGVSLTPYPVPVFTFNCVGRTCTVNATGTTGPSPITNYHWDWGDETTTDTAAVTAQHTFLWADAFQVTLMVTDTNGLNGFVTHTRRVGMADSVGIFDRADGKFHLRSAGINDKYLFFLSAAAGNQPVAGDWNGDAVRTGGKFNDATGELALTNSLSKTSQDLPVHLLFTLQAPGTGRVPIAGDWNGDGIDSAGLYNPATQTFYLRNSLTTGPADITLTFTGAGSGWRPVAGDWDLDGVDSVGLYDPATSTFYLRNLNTTGGAQTTFVFGTPGTDRWPVAGDWVASGRSTIGLYLQSTHTFQLRNSNTAGAADSQFTTGTGTDTPPIAGYWYMP